MKHFFRFVAAVALVGAGAGMAQAADLTVEVTGLKNTRGKVLVAVFDRAENFLKQPMRTAAIDAAAAQAGKVQLVITGLPTGDYALSVFQDENGNGDLDMNPLGMPVEPYGFSNDAAGSFGPPSFAQSVVHLPEVKLITIKLR